MSDVDVKDVSGFPANSLNTSESRSRRLVRFVRALPVMVGVFLITAAAVYCVSWYVQAASARQTVMQLIENMNRAHPGITYSTIETSGFPLDVNVSIVQPRYTFRQPATATTPEQSQDIALNGSIVLGVNVFSNRFTAMVDGPITESAIINGSRTSLFTVPQGPLLCRLEMQDDGDDLWSMQRLPQLVADDVLHNLRFAECSSAGYKVGDTATREQMFSSGPFLMRYGSQPETASTRTFDFTLRLTDVVFSQRMNDLLNLQLATVATHPETLPRLDLAAYGKQNADIALVWHGPSDGRLLNANTPFSLDVERFNISNALYSTNSQLSVQNRLTGNGRAATFVLDSESSFSKTYDQYLVDYARIVLARIQASTDPALAQMRTSLARLTPAQTTELLKPVIPQLHSFGNISVHVNAGIDGSMNFQKLEFSTEPYGLALKGAASLLEHGRAPPNASFTLSCRNCLMLVDDAMHYSERLQQAVGTLDRNLATMLPSVSPQLGQGVQTFLSALGDKIRDPATGADALVYQLVTDASGNISINGKTPAQVSLIYNSTVAPYLTPQPQPQPQSQPGGVPGVTKP